MPTYTYRCNHCATVFERFQRITASAEATCTRCGSDDCTRQITGGTFHLKGRGWYASDYGGKTRPPAEHACNGKGPEGGCQGACAASEATASA